MKGSGGFYKKIASIAMGRGSVATDANIFARLQAIFRDELDLPDLKISPQSTPEQIDGWDSLATIRIVAAAEREFDCQLEASQIENIQSVADLASMIEACR